MSCRDDRPPRYQADDPLALAGGLQIRLHHRYRSRYGAARPQRRHGALYLGEEGRARVAVGLAARPASRPTPRRTADVFGTYKKPALRVVPSPLNLLPTATPARP